MALNQGPNSQTDVDTSFSDGINRVVDKITNPSISNMLGTPGRDLARRAAFLDGWSKDINKPILKAMATDMLAVMASWLNDPEVLCCLIQGIYSAYLAQNQHSELGKFMTRNITLADTDFAKWIDNLIAFLDFVIILLTQDTKRFIFLIPDIIKEVYVSIMGAIILLVQETAFALRDSIIAVIFEWMDSWDKETTWSKCLPLKQMINVLKKYTNDYGLLASIFEKIKGFLSAKRAKLKDWSKNVPFAVKDLEFLYWVRDLLIKLKRAVLNFDVCVDYQFIPTPDKGPETGKFELKKKTYAETLNAPDRDNTGDVSEQGGYTTGADGSLIVDKDKVINGNWIPRLSNSFLRDFIHKEYGIPYDVIDNTITRGTSADHIQGSIVTSNTPNTILDRCSNTPSADETLQWILNLRSRLK